MSRFARSLRAAVALLMVLAAGIVSPFLAPGSAAAHPLGNFTFNRYARVELYRGEAVVHYVLDLAEIPTFQLAGEIDRDGDGEMSAAELDAFLPVFAAEVTAGIRLDRDGAAIPLDLVKATPAVSEGQGGLDVLRVALVLRGEVPDGPAKFTFIDSNYPDRPGWKEIVIAPSAGAAATVDAAFLGDSSDALRNYPADALGETPADSAVNFTWDAASGAAAPADFAAEEAGNIGRGDRFARLLEADRSLGIILLSLLAAFGFGALHALGPGHGKSVVAAYLVGSKGTPRHALALGVTVTATHTAAVYGLGFVTLVASDLIAPEQLFVYLGVVSGALIAVMGVTLLVGRLRGMAKKREDDGLHRHGLFGKAHSHLTADSRVHAEPEHAHGPETHVHGHESPHHAHAEAEPKVTWRGLVTLGIAGGLIPCPSALVVMLAAISLGQVLFGMLLIVAFSFGLAGVLVAIGLALVLGRRLSGRAGRIGTFRRPVFARLLSAAPIASALAVTVAGVAITYQAWNQPGL